MINIIDNQTMLEFGSGDICINSATMDNGKIGAIVFCNQEPRDIGVNNGDVKIGKEYYLDDFPVVMTFTKKESVDVLIYSLEKMKEFMEI